MKIEKMASVPLILQDPYISIWSSADRLYEGDTTHWCGKKQRLYGFLVVDGKEYCFLGEKGDKKGANQTGLTVTATTTTYEFKVQNVCLTVSFCSPLLLTDPVLVSRPCTYLDFLVENPQGHEVEVLFGASSDIVSSTGKKILGGAYTLGDYHYAYMGNAVQAPLSHSGDNITIDWGNLYLASRDAHVKLLFDKGWQAVAARMEFAKEKQAQLVFAYDDGDSIRYFDENRKGYWTETYGSIYEAIRASIEEHDELLERCRDFDKELEKKAETAGGEAYVYLCNASYRHAIAAHKLISDKEGNLIFLSKENDSNGCIGTVDVSYPSVPLFLMYDTDYVKGMLRPVFKFASLPVWEYDFAPHDVGRYPYATGQVYGLNPEKDGKEYDGSNGNIFPNFYSFPRNSQVYTLKNQMPVEECGNMLILCAAVTLLDKNTDFVREYMDILEKWVVYLTENGMDPGEQLCTDDFAGHLSHNVNLSAKAILGVEGYALILKALGNQEGYDTYHGKARAMADHWKKTADAGDHTRLTFDREDSWSLKYNLVWDRFFGSGLFDQGLFDRELAYYVKKNNAYGVPLDSRADYTKSDWILWCTALTDCEAHRKKLVEPVTDYLMNTTTRVPFSDWYDTKDGRYCHFIARSVQGGIFMPMFMDEKNGKM